MLNSTEPSTECIPRLSVANVRASAANGLSLHIRPVRATPSIHYGMELYRKLVTEHEGRHIMAVNLRRHSRREKVYAT